MQQIQKKKKFKSYKKDKTTGSMKIMMKIMMIDDLNQIVDWNKKARAF